MRVQPVVPPSIARRRQPGRASLGCCAGASCCTRSASPRSAPAPQAAWAAVGAGFRLPIAAAGAGGHPVRASSRPVAGSGQGRPGACPSPPRCGTPALPPLTRRPSRGGGGAAWCGLPRARDWDRRRIVLVVAAPAERVSSARCPPRVRGARGSDAHADRWPGAVAEDHDGVWSTRGAPAPAPARSPGSLGDGEH